MAEVVTSLPEMEVDVEGFPVIGGGNIATPESGIFKRGSDVEFPSPDSVKLPDSSGKVEDKTPEIVPAGATQKEALDAIVSQDNEVPDETSSDLVDDRPEKTGKPRIDKSAMVEYLKGKIESKDFVTFDDYDEKAPLEEYLGKLSNKDLSSLVDENLKLKADKLREDDRANFYDNLPEDFKVAYEYIANGGQDLKGLYKALSDVREIKDLDPNDENSQEEIVEEYLKNTHPDWKSEEIKEQVDEWKNEAILAKKATQFKPKLDKIKEDTVRYQLREQEEFNRQRQEAAQMYVKNVHEALLPGELNGLKLDPKTQSSLYYGLVKADYQSITGGNTNELGYLLEENQYRKPNYSLIAEVLWHLKDPDGFKNALVEKGKNAQTENIVKKLKTAQGDRSSSAAFDDGGEVYRTRNKSIPRTVSPFKR